MVIPRAPAAGNGRRRRPLDRAGVARPRITTMVVQPAFPDLPRDVDTPSPLLIDLNPIQREAVLHIEGPVLIVAGAGSGKTRALTHRIAYLIREKDVSPYAILAITFTNKAAQEMAERVEGLMGTRIAKGMWILTFHSACVRILRREHEHVGLPVLVHHLRRRGHGTGHRHGREGHGRRSEAVPAAPGGRDDRTGQGRPAGPGPVLRAGRELLRADGGEHLRGVPAAAALGGRARLRRHHHGDRAPVPRAPGGARALPGAVPVRPDRRVPGHEPGAVPPGEHARGEAPEPVRGGRRRPGRVLVARGHDPEPAGLRARLPRRHGPGDGPELPVHAGHPAGGQRTDRAQRAAQAQVAVDQQRGRRPGRAVPRRQRARGGVVRRHRDRAPGRERGVPLRRRRHLLPDERAVPCLRGRVHEGGPQLQDHRRGPVLPAQGDQGRPGLPARRHEPQRRREPAPGDQHAEARHRRRHGGGHRGVRARRGRLGHGGVQAGRPHRRAGRHGRRGPSPGSCG